MRITYDLAIPLAGIGKNVHSRNVYNLKKETGNKQLKCSLTKEHYGLLTRWNAIH